MTDLTTPSLRPFTGPCAALHCEDPAVYGPGAGPEDTEAERLERMARGGPGALASHELLALLGVRIDAPRSPRRGACAGSATTPATPCARPGRRARTCCGYRPSSRSTPGGWRRGCAAAASSRAPATPAATPRRGFRAEVFAALFLDARHRVIAFEPLFRGTVGGASVHPREVVRRLRGFRHLAKVIEGVRFNDGIEVIEDRRAARSRTSGEYLASDFICTFLPKTQRV